MQLQEQKIAAITTTLTGEYDQAKFDYAYFSALLYGFDAIGWGEKDFSASSAQLPMRPRKRYFGNKNTTDIINENDVLTRHTNVGIKVNTITRTVDYLI